MLTKIQDILDNIDDFTQISPFSDEKVNVNIEKLILRVFKILRKKKRGEDRSTLQELAINLVEQHTKGSIEE